VQGFYRSHLAPTPPSTAGPCSELPSAACPAASPLPLPSPTLGFSLPQPVRHGQPRGIHIRVRSALQETLSFKQVFIMSAASPRGVTATCSGNERVSLILHRHTREPYKMSPRKRRVTQSWRIFLSLLKDQSKC